MSRLSLQEQIDRAQAGREDRQEEAKQGRRTVPTPRTKDGVRRSRLNLKRLDQAADKAYGAASEALDSLKQAKDRESTTSGGTVDRNRFPSLNDDAGRPPS